MWLGMSMLGLVELLQLIINIIYIIVSMVVKRIKVHNKVGTTGGGTTEGDNFLVIIMTDWSKFIKQEVKVH